MNFYLITYDDGGSVSWLWNTITIDCTPAEWLVKQKENKVIMWSCAINEEEYDALKKKGY